MNRPREDREGSDPDSSEFAGEAASESEPTPEQMALKKFLEERGFQSKIKRGWNRRPEIELQHGEVEIITIFDFGDGLIIGVFGFPDEDRLRALLQGKDMSYRIDKLFGHGQQGHYYRISPER